jgi:hypothetical protein
MRRRILLLLTTAALGVATAPSALACGYGVGATLTSIDAPAVENGHVAGCVGVGGPRLGPHGTSEWIQVGYAAFPGILLGTLHYEVALPGRAPAFHDISTSVHAGEQHRVAMLEVAHHSNRWPAEDRRHFRSSGKCHAFVCDRRRASGRSEPEPSRADAVAQPSSDELQSPW